MDEEKQPPATVAERIRWHDEEQGQPSRRPRPSPSRGVSSDSMSIRRVASRNQVDPAVSLPIQYRTVSFQIEDSKGKDAAELAKAKDKTAKDLNDLEWHTISPHEVEQRLRTSASTGLSTEQIKKRCEEYGRNAPSPPETHRTKQILGYFFKGFGGILLIGAILVLISWEPLGDPPALANLVLAAVLFAVFLIQAAFSMFQDWSTSRVMASIKDMLPEHCQVTRDGLIVNLSAVDLVPGDLVTIKAGNKLPADVRFLEVSPDAKFDRSVLTGESVPIAASVENTDTNYLETRNIGLQGTHCIIGSSIGLVVATGDRTVFGRIAKLTNEPKTKLTTMEKEILYFVGIIVTIMLIMIILIIALWAGWLRKEHPDFINVPTLIVDCVSVAIAFIPEGLPIAVSAGLTITAKLMRNQSILCKSLKTVETLGAVSVICSDKTGTLTAGKMTVSDCSIQAHDMTVETAQHQFASSRGPSNAGIITNAVGQLRAMAALCNAADFDVTDTHSPLATRKMFGDATDQATLRFAEQVEEGAVAYLRACWLKVFEVPFNSKNKYMVRCFTCVRREVLAETLPDAVVRDFDSNDILLTMKGAPDVLLERCTSYISTAGDVKPFNLDVKSTFERIKNSYSSQGKRCILLANKVVKCDSFKAQHGTSDYEKEMLEQAKQGLTIIGLVAIVDPLRAEIPDVVTTLRGAGIRINMVTGDFALTAVAIAREAGIITSLDVDTLSTLSRSPSSSPPSFDKPTRARNALVISGPELLTLTDHQWQTLTEYEEIVFARTTPEQKLRIVKEFQRNSIVAMTGDGVNDAPSLKAADVGISLGSGSDIAMEAADMVLLDSFSSVVAAVQYGRVVFDNLKKVIAYLLPAGSFSEFWPVFTSVAFGLPQILSSFLMIIICCFTDGAAATMLAYEKPEADVLRRPPRDTKKDRLVNWKLIFHAYAFIGILQSLASFAMAYWYLERKGIPFRDIWFSFGKLPDTIDQDYYQEQLNIASSIYFVNLVVMQWFNLMSTRTRRLSIFQHPPAFNKTTQNLYLFPAIIFAVVMAIVWLYPEPFNRVLGTAPIPVEYWFLPFSFGIGVLLLDEARKYFVRTRPNGVAAKVAW